MTDYTAADAIQMLRAAGTDLRAELTNISAAYADITDEIEQADGHADFTIEDFGAALKGAL